jgi:mannosylglycoprotein endo-beta-mannosidase
MRAIEIDLEEEREQLGQHNLEEYAQRFQQPLSALHIKALAALFGWLPPDDVSVQEPFECLVLLWIPFHFGRFDSLFMDPSHILVWNVRGLNSVTRRDAVRVVVNSYKIDVVCLQETKMVTVSRQIVLSMLGCDFDNNYIFLPSVGASGGILIAWRSCLGTVCATRVDTFSASVQFNSDNRGSWWLTCVYGPQDNQAKIQFLQELRDVRVQCTGPWMVAGDFNLIYKDEDKNNSNLNRAMMGRFRRWIEDMAVNEIPLHGRKFTWSSSSSNASPTLVRLDRVFCSLDWEEMFPDCLLLSAASDDS